MVWKCPLLRKAKGLAFDKHHAAHNPLEQQQRAFSPPCGATRNDIVSVMAQHFSSKYKGVVYVRPCSFARDFGGSNTEEERDCIVCPFVFPYHPAYTLRVSLKPGVSCYFALRTLFR